MAPGFLEGFSVRHLSVCAVNGVVPDDPQKELVVRRPDLPIVADSNDMKQCRLHKSAPGKSSLIGASFKMTKEGTFTMISRVVVVRHLGGLLCAVGPMVSLF